VKFLHAADIHLDSPLRTFRRLDAAPELLACTRRAFTNLVDLAIAEDVAFVVLAGDLYDGDWKDFSTGLFFAAEMRRLARPCYVIRGNHDAASIITSGLQLSLPPNVVVFSDKRCETESDRLADYGIAIHGRSFAHRREGPDFIDSYNPPVPGRLNIGLLHTSLTNTEHETYAPCGPETLAARGYDYWALGHVHTRAVFGSDPWIVFPGNIQGRSVREPGAKGITLVEVQDRRIVGLEHRSIDVLRWVLPRVDVTGIDDTAGLAGLVREHLEAELAGAEGRPLLARVTLAGATALHRRLLAEPNLADAECRNAADAAGGVIIERVRLELAPPASAPDEATAGAMAELHAAFLAARQDAELSAELRGEIDKLLRDIPQAAMDDELKTLADPDAFARLADEAWDIVAGRMEPAA
jgi:exonuclease SbcD